MKVERNHITTALEDRRPFRYLEKSDIVFVEIVVGFGLSLLLTIFAMSVYLVVEMSHLREDFPSPSACRVVVDEIADGCVVHVHRN